jgi:hypothetical protein
MIDWLTPLWHGGERESGESKKNPAAVALGRLGGLKGGKRRNASEGLATFFSLFTEGGIQHFQQTYMGACWNVRLREISF